MVNNDEAKNNDAVKQGDSKVFTGFQTKHMAAG